MRLVMPIRRIVRTSTGVVIFPSNSLLYSRHYGKLCILGQTCPRSGAGNEAGGGYCLGDVHSMGTGAVLSRANVGKI